MIRRIKDKLLDFLLKGGEEMSIAMLYSSHIILGKRNFEDVPVKIQPLVRDILMAEGLEELIG